MLVSEKLDVLGERHDQAVVDLQQSMSETHHIITERETEVAMLTERCGGTGHIFTGKCTQETERESQGRPKARQSEYIFSICDLSRENVH